MILSLGVIALVGALLIAFGHRLGRAAFVVAAVAPLVSLAWVVARLPGVADGEVVSESVSWVGELGLTIDLRLDGLAATMSLIVTGIGVLVLLYATRYFGRDAADLGRIAGLLVLFAGAMVGVVQADNLLLLYTCWELTSVTSYFLIGNKHTDPAARSAALQALLITGAGGLAMLGGFVIIGETAGTYRLSELVQQPLPSSSLVTVAMVLILVGAFTKSAQVPFHSWLPGAMVAPTPISAYLHSATMVKAGVFLIARFAPIFVAFGAWRPLVITVGIVTMVVGGLRALRQHDLKLLLAFGTISQLGLMVVLFGAGTPTAMTAGWTLLVAHALFKAALFMIVGVLDHETGTRDIRRLPVLDERWRWVRIAAVVSAASMAGVPFFEGFIAKEEAYAAFAEGRIDASALVLGAIVVGSMFTVAYSARFYWGAFVAARGRVEGAVQPERVTPPAVAFYAPAALLAVLSVVLGVVPGLVDPLATASVRWLDAAVEPVELALWHGINLPLALSVLTLGGGAALFFADRWVQPVLAVGRRIPSGGATYLALLRGTGTLSRRVTGIVQNGSLPVYAGVILATVAILPAGALVLSWDWEGWPDLFAVQDVPVVGLLLVAALGAAMVRRRFAAAIFLGATGYAMAGLFVLFGAPDLALTQAVIETLTTVVFVLVLRRLPERFERQSSPSRRALRIAIALVVGAMVFVFALVASGNRLEPPISDEMVARSVPDGHGSNVVNVILVDFRGLDTLGEITVLGVASIGAVALARAGRRGGRETVERPAPPPEEVRRIVFVDVSVQVIYYVVLMASLWLLFAGHNQPGGGFVGGLLAGSAITLHYVAGGMKEVRGLSRFAPWTILGSGLLIASTMAVLGLATESAVLDVGSLSVSLPVIGELEVSSALLFDIGVYISVVGMVLIAFEAFGDEPEEVLT